MSEAACSCCYEPCLFYFGCNWEGIDVPVLLLRIKWFYRVSSLSSGCPLSGLKPNDLLLIRKAFAVKKEKKKKNKNLCQTALRLFMMDFILNWSEHLSYSKGKIPPPFINLGTSLPENGGKTRAGDVSQCITHTCQTSSYHDPLLHALFWFLSFFKPMISMPPFFCFTFDLFVIFQFSQPSLFCLFPVFGWIHFLCVLSFPVQCWSLSYGKQRRPFRLCAPTWLRQQVWRTFNFFSTWTLFVVAFSPFFYYENTF